MNTSILNCVWTVVADWGAAADNSRALTEHNQRRRIVFVNSTWCLFVSAVVLTNVSVYRPLPAYLRQLTLALTLTLTPGPDLKEPGLPPTEGLPLTVHTTTWKYYMRDSYTDNNLTDYYTSISNLVTD